MVMLSYVRSINKIVYSLVIHEISYKEKAEYIKSMLYSYCYYLNDNIGNDKDSFSFLLTYIKL
jgi:hypothetical protein